MPVPQPRKRPYHHGDLRESLIDTAIAIIGERGVGGFSIAEASRRLGVTSAAPYRHFADRDRLLAAAAARAADRLAADLAAATAEEAGPADRLAAAARAYVRFTAERPALFHVLYHSGLDKSAHPELLSAGRGVSEQFTGPARDLLGATGDADALALAAAASAHGHAMLLADEPPGGADARTAADRAAVAVRALVAGWPRTA
ncbi:TetR/AcrR family transcriptional regulator [Streptomonospora nanhaiensis]|uniref:AcrR family transcriptional regulator n=2 Tax=Streptomonospora nanhaiensis TaxID=1323731 RepID=A0A853BJJ6_9ACTN|nr:helix-turn-helix domain-containing protein [Streptomonospora nanhaiensis]MBX9390908.1 TetR/AcrR family transcriptional regulator [Streptomonospora nanhaiensis]NYI95649.1 AcrR family transcriptional regulator [Streptomonospora nanhaiensis]